MKFKVGDRVTVVANPSNFSSVDRVIGRTFTITHINERVDYPYSLDSTEIRFTATNDSEIELEEIVNSPLYQAMRE